MKKHRHYEHLIDEYLLGKLKPEDQDEFEAHYFICPHCFAKLDQQSEIVQILKKEGMLETYGVACEHAGPRRAWWRRLAGAAPSGSAANRAKNFRRFLGLRQEDRKNRRFCEFSPRSAARPSERSSAPASAPRTPGSTSAGRTGPRSWSG